MTRNVALKELQDKDSEIQRLKAASRDVAQVQMQLRKEILLKEGYAQQLSEAQVSRTDERTTFEAELKAKETSLEQSGKRVSELETLLQQEQNHILQLQQTVRTGEAKILALENQVAIEQSKIQQLQQETVGKDNEISRLMSIPPPQSIAPDFSTMLTELYVSYWEKVKQFCPSLQSVLRFLSDAQTLCTEAGHLINNSMLIIGLKFPIAQNLIQLLYSALKEELKEKGIADRRQLIKRTNVFINRHRIIMQVSAALVPLQFSIPDIKRRVEKFVSLDLPSPFLADGSVLRIEQVLQQIEIL